MRLDVAAVGMRILDSDKHAFQRVSRVQYGILDHFKEN